MSDDSDIESPREVPPRRWFSDEAEDDSAEWGPDCEDTGLDEACDDIADSMEEAYAGEAYAERVCLAYAAVIRTAVTEEQLERAVRGLLILAANLRGEE